jgi:hypothetical protein
VKQQSRTVHKLSVPLKIFRSKRSYHCKLAIYLSFPTLFSVFSFLSLNLASCPLHAHRGPSSSVFYLSARPL